MWIDLLVCALATLSFYCLPLAALGLVAFLMALGDRLWQPGLIAAKLVVTGAHSALRGSSERGKK